MKMKIDRISELPDHIVEEILERLPIRDAVRTSLLSSKWRHKWTTIPSLEFSLTPWRRRLISVEEFVSTTDHVLSQHVGPIQKFKLYYNAVGPIIKLSNHDEHSLPNRDIDRWILRLSRSHIKELSLVFFTRQRYTLPSCIFSYQNLTQLNLSSCTLRPPATFKGFENLKSLELRSVNLAQDVLEIIISSSPVLERVCLAGLCKDVRSINLDAPNLRSFKFESDKFAEITFRNTSSLAEVSIFLPHLCPAERNIQVSQIPKFFDHLSHVQTLEVSGSFLEYLALGGLPKEYPLRNLRSLSMVVRPNRQEDILTAICLLRSAPNLEELSISEWKNCNIEDVDLNFSEAKHMTCQFNKLRRASIANMIGCKFEIDFINYVLSASPMLERLTIKPGSSYCKSMVEKSLCFELASNRAEIVVS